MNYVFLCDTPYQLFNCINFAYHYIDSQKDAADIFISHQSKKLKRYSDNLKKIKVFNNVYDVEYYVNRTQSIHNDIVNIYRMFSPKKTIKKHLISKVCLKNKKYDVAIMSIAAQFMVHFLSFFPNIRVYFIEDGLGSYNNNIILDIAKKKYQVFYKLTKKGSLGIQPERLYVNNVSLCKSVIAPEIYPLPNIDGNRNKFIDILINIFDYKDKDIYNSNKYVYLTQPIDQSLNDYNQIIKSLGKHDLVVRIHPQDTTEYIANKGIYFDKSSSLWELIAAFNIREDHVLIGNYSSAQLTPKIIFNKEPYLIFTYFLSSDPYIKSLLSQIEDNIENIKKIYNDKTKIKTPKTINELNFIFEHLKRN